MWLASAIVFEHRENNGGENNRMQIHARGVIILPVHYSTENHADAICGFKSAFYYFVLSSFCLFYRRQNLKTK